MSLWSAELMDSELAKDASLPTSTSDWLGYEPASEGELTALEARLGVILPPSYRSFLLMSNGWRRTTFAIERIRSAEEVDWFRVENEQWAEIYSEIYSDADSDLPDLAYYEYPGGSSGDIRGEHMNFLLQISDVHDGVYLLNPRAVTPDGEWEAWFFANWIPGARRYPSFAHLMLAEYLSFAQVERVEVAEASLPKLAIPRAEEPRIPAKRAKGTKAAKKEATLEELIGNMTEQEGKPPAKTIRTFVGKLRGRPGAKRRPDLVPTLVALFRSSNHADVRSACVSALTELADDAEAPSPLLESLSDSDAGVVLSGIFALHYFPNPKALEPLCRFVESSAAPIFKENAMSALGMMGDERAVPTLRGVLLNTLNHFDQSFGNAAIALSKCGPRGFEALISALDHSDPRVRHAVVVGLDCSGHPLAADFLDRMLEDRDPVVAQRARVRIGKRTS